MSNKSRYLIPVVALLLLCASVTIAAPLPGAIFTTNVACGSTDLNLYASKADVYVNGGPAHPGAAGLPAGFYWIKVTAPDGTLLGVSTTAIVEVGAGGQFVQCYQLAAIVVKASDGTPGYDSTPNPGGEYKVWVSTVSTFDNDSTKTDNFKVPADCIGDDCGGEVSGAVISVEKYQDVNANGLYDDGLDIPISGWPFCVQQAAGAPDCVHVTPSGPMLVVPDTYTVTEGNPTTGAWVHSGCTDTLNGIAAPCASISSDTVTLAADDAKDIMFGNVCLGAGGGLTLGFWSNRNGQALIDSGDILMLVTLNLVNATGSPFGPTTAANVKSWLLSANATNMAYMLSAQLATMELNVANGFVSSAALVYAPCLIGTATPGANSLGFISITDLMAAANTSLGANPLTVSAGPVRTYQECLKTALDRANNNLNFVQTTACALPSF